jgi:hypothetical protein
MGAALSTLSTPTSPIQQTSLFTMQSFSTEQIASIKKIQLRFVDRKLGNKYDADCSFVRVLFETNGDTATVPQDVMDRLRERVFVLMDNECTNEAERKHLRLWTQNFIFMTSKGKRMRNSRHVREAIADAIKADEATLPVFIDSSSCNTAVVVTPPRRKSVKTVAMTVAVDTTPLNPTKAMSVTVTKLSRSRPPLAPKALNVNASASSQAKRSLKNVLNKEAAPFQPSMATLDALDKAAKKNTDNGGVVMKSTTTPEDDMFPDKTTSVLNVITGNDQEIFADDEYDEDFDLKALLEGCLGEDVLMLTEPDDYSPLIVEKEGGVSFLTSVIVYGEDATTVIASAVSDGEDEPFVEDHSYLLPSFFDESMSLMTATSNGCVDMEGGSSLFNETERNILQSALEIIGDDADVLAV